MIYHFSGQLGIQRSDFKKKKKENLSICFLLARCLHTQTNTHEFLLTQTENTGFKRIENDCSHVD